MTNHGAIFKQMLEEYIEGIEVQDFSYSEDSDAFRVHFWVSCEAANEFEVEHKYNLADKVISVAKAVFEDTVKGPIGVLEIWNMMGDKAGQYELQINAFLEPAKDPTSLLYEPAVKI